MSSQCQDEQSKNCNSIYTPRPLLLIHCMTQLIQQLLLLWKVDDRVHKFLHSSKYDDINLKRLELMHLKAQVNRRGGVLYLLSDTFGHTEDESDGLMNNVSLERMIAQLGDEETEEKERGDGFHSPLKGLQY